MQANRYIWAVVSFIVLLGIATGLYALDDAYFGGDTRTTIEWNTYESERFSFSIEYPASWEVGAFPENEIAPTFNFYDPTTTEQEPPFTHHNDVVNVSVFPQGVPTEGVFGESIESTTEIGEAADRARDFILSDGTVWAVFAGLSDTPSSWGEAGFLWARAAVRGLDVTCLRDGEMIPSQACDPLFGDTVVREGEVDEAQWNIIEHMLSSFRYLEEDGGTVCIQVITPARNPNTGEVRDFPTPCDVPDGWEVVR